MQLEMVDRTTDSFEAESYGSVKSIGAGIRLDHLNMRVSRYYTEMSAHGGERKDPSYASAPAFPKMRSTPPKFYEATVKGTEASR